MWQTLISLCLALSGQTPRRRAPRRRPAFRRPLRPRLEVLEDRTVLSPYLVTTTADTGLGSLRDAINAIKADVNPDGSSKLSYTNSDPTRDEIDFAITATSDTAGGGTGYNATTGVATITPMSALPVITNAVLIDGYTQGQGTPLAASPDNQANEDNAVLKIELNGSSFDSPSNGASNPSVHPILWLGGGDTVRGLVINRGIGAGVVCGGTGDTLSGNFIGTDVSGTVAEGNTGADVYSYARGATIGGTTPADRNVISGAVSGANASGLYGDGIREQVSSYDVIEGNFIGTDYSGTRGLPNLSYGIAMSGASNVTVGGTAAGAGNVISGNGLYGIIDNASVGTVIQGNFIGTNASGTRITDGAGNPLGNVIGIMSMSAGGAVIGPTPKEIADGTAGTISQLGTAGFAGNLISGNGTGIEAFGSGNLVQGNYIGTDWTGLVALGNGNGIYIPGSANNTIGGTAAGAGNVIAGNHDRGIEMDGGSGNSILGNSFHDNGGGIVLNNGANNNQAAPVLTAAYAASSATIITGTMGGTSGTKYRLEFFANTAGDPEGRTFLGSADVYGNSSFIAPLSVALPAGQNLVTATATDPSDNTSEFSAGVTATPLPPSSLSGVVWEDFNDDGQVDFGENGISGVIISLTGTDFLGNAVNQSQQTDGDGAYVFGNLYPGNYCITEAQPAGYTQGIDPIGTAGGSLMATDQFCVALGVGQNGLNYNFGERPPSGGGVQHGQTAGIGFWNNKNGQALIRALNGGGADGHGAHQLGDWLAATMPNTFAALAGQDNASVAALFQRDFVMKGVKLDAQLLATALSVYATNATLDPTKAAATYGFTVSGDGAGAATFNVGSNGDAFGVANNTTMTVIDLLLAADAQAVNGVLYGGNAARRNEANAVFSAVNQAGDI